MGNDRTKYLGDALTFEAKNAGLLNSEPASQQLPAAARPDAPRPRLVVVATGEGEFTDEAKAARQAEQRVSVTELMDFVYGKERAKYVGPGLIGEFNLEHTLNLSRSVRDNPSIAANYHQATLLNLPAPSKLHRKFMRQSTAFALPTVLTDPLNPNSEYKPWNLQHNESASCLITPVCFKRVWLKADRRCKPPALMAPRPLASLTISAFLTIASLPGSERVTTLMALRPLKKPGQHHLLRWSGAGWPGVTTAVLSPSLFTDTLYKFRLGANGAADAALPREDHRFVGIERGEFIGLDGAFVHALFAYGVVCAGAGAEGVALAG